MNKKANICRVCLELECQQSDYVPLSENYHDFVLYEFINAITSLKIRLSDGFPDKICTACYSQLTASIDFKEKCETSDVTLRTNAVKQKLLEDYENSLVKSEDEGETIKTEYNDVNSDDCVEFTPDLESDEKSDVKENSNEEQLAYDIPPAADRPSRAIDLKLICDDCGGSFKSKCKLKVHWKRTHMYESLICPRCKRTFKSYRAFHQHKKKKSIACEVATDDNVAVEGVGKSRIFCCKRCDYRSTKIQFLKAHIVTHTGDKPYKCNMCPNSYTQLSTLISHKEMTHHLYSRRITCHICGKKLEGRWRIEHHMRLHNKIECPVCHKSITKANYTQHSKQHSGIKTYKCDKCTDTFFTASGLCAHRHSKHSDKDKLRFKCEQCQFTCKTKKSLHNHSSKHNSIDIPCTVCGKFFDTKEKLVHHQRLHFTEPRYCCSHCEKRYFERNAWRHHMKAKHPETVPGLKTGPLGVKTANSSFKNKK